MAPAGAWRDQLYAKLDRHEHGAFGWVFFEKLIGFVVWLVGWAHSGTIAAGGCLW